MCKHHFDLNDLKSTGIPPLEPPRTNDYDEWKVYYADVHTHDSHTKRVLWPCSKCGKTFYAHCGLDILNK